MASNLSSPHVLILGAGIGGLTLAQSLRKKGIPYEIFERDASDHARPEGWAIGIHSMIDDLKASLPDDMSPVEELSHLRPLNLPAQLALYAFPDYPKVGVRDDGSDSILRINRWRLRDWLATNLPIQYGKRAVRVEEGKGSVTAHFSDGTSATGDILVGAEGAHSATRRHIFPESDPLQVENILIISGDVMLDQHEMERELSRGYSGYVVSFDDVDGVYSTVFIGLNEVLPGGKSGKYFFHLQQRRPDADKQDFWAFKASAEQLLDEARRITATVPARFKTLLDKATPEGVRVPPLRMYCLLLDSLPESRITLLGDAAHAMTARSHAIRDGLNLARAIAKMDMNDEQTWKKAVGEYQKEMVARGSNASRLSHEAFDRKTFRGDGGARYIWGEPVHPLPEETITL